MSAASGPASRRLEVCTLVRRLALNLGCKRVALTGRGHPDFAGLAPELELIGDDTPPTGAILVCSAAALLAAELPAELRTRVEAAEVSVFADYEGLGTSIAAAERLDDIAHNATVLGLRVLARGLIRTGPGRPARDGALLVVGDGDRADPARELLATGTSGLLLDRATTGTEKAPARVAIVSFEFVGPTKNGGIGTGNTSLARALAGAGHDVVAIFSGNHSLGPEAIASWRDAYAANGVELHVMSPAGDRSICLPHFNLRRSFAAYEWLLWLHGRRPFDVIHFPECQAHGYHTVMAKRHGLAFENTTIVLGTHSPTRWVREANLTPAQYFSDVIDDHFERRCVELADVVISPSAYMLDWISDRGWELPERSYVQQYVQPHAARAQAPRGERPVSELVFFGRLEMRKGLESFCDTIDLLHEQGRLDGKRVTFLGSASSMGALPARDYIAMRADRWTVDWQVVDDLDQPEAVAYLQEHDCVAVMPSLVDNLPNTVIEAVGLGIPFIASAVGGTVEIVDPADVPTHMFDPRVAPAALEPLEPSSPRPRIDPATLAARVVAVLERTPEPARPALDPALTERAHCEWHALVAAAQRRQTVARPATVSPAPQIAACLAAPAHPRGGLVRLLAELAAQEGAELEIVTAGTGAGPPDTRWIETASRSTGGALNAAAGATEAAWLLFNDGSVSPLPRQVATLARIAAHANPDVVVFPLAPPADADGSRPDWRRLVPCGGPPLLGTFFDCFSSGSYLIRRDVFEAVGGFAEDADAEDAHHALLSAVALAGFEIEVAPVVLGRLCRWDEDDPRAAADVPSIQPDSRPQSRARVAPYYAAGGGFLQDLPALIHNAWGHHSGRLGWELEGLRWQVQNTTERADWLESQRDALVQQLGEHVQQLDAQQQEIERLTQALESARQSMP